MMTTASVLTILIGAQPAAPACAPTVGSVGIVANVSLPFRLQRPREELRDDYRKLRRAARRGKADPFELTPPIVRLYEEISAPDSLLYSERNRALRNLRSDLRTMSEKLARSRGDRSPADRRRGRTIGSPGASAGAPSTLANARRLIRLIQSVIQPESWDVNGGPGSIQFYRPLNALVVRASAEVHGQIGGVLPNLRGK